MERAGMEPNWNHLLAKESLVILKAGLKSAIASANTSEMVAVVAVDQEDGQEGIEGGAGRAFLLLYPTDFALLPEKRRQEEGSSAGHP